MALDMVFVYLQLMKRLVLIRHAKSSWKDPLLGDFDRPLNKRGERDAPNMAKRLKEKKIFPDTVLSSPSFRTRATCNVFCETLNFDTSKVIFDRSLYHADTSNFYQVLSTLKDLPDTEEVVLLFGHNPGLTEFSNSLFDAEIENVPTCGVVCGTLKISRWKELQPHSGVLDFFDYPKRKKHK